ncbi:MAG: stage III sporulation protein AD [Thermaerobacter sp.]|nr:stage III sporulation protein AD [Thermaerobacter sp.]MDA8144855.1 stage III sporulation protein AD [Thermaerobacter sp.]
MHILQIVGFALVAAVLTVVVRRLRPELGLLLSLAAGVVILLLVLPSLLSVFQRLRYLSAAAQVNLRYLDTVLKIVGVAYLTEFGAQICRDAGEGALAAKVELAGKVLILLLSVPILNAILDLLIKLLP